MRLLMQLVLLFVYLLHVQASSGAKYWVSFTDKNGVAFDPYTYFSDRTIEQRCRWNIPIDDITDYPVKEEYIVAVSAFADSLSYSSRWLNGVAVYTDALRAEDIRRLPFVSAVTLMTGVCIPAENEPVKPGEETALLKYQTDRMQGKLFRDKNLDGSGIRIAVFDAGFPGVDKHPAFQHLFKNNRVIATYDFAGRDEDVYKHHWHGTGTLSCIAGMAGENPVGLATGAEYLLARTEHAVREPFAEEEYWLAAAEWADKHGANIISSSLGYTYQRYFNTQMDGHTSFVARAATIAAQKGILVVNSAGNEGSESWNFIGTPADADSVLSVGGTDPETDIRIFFSSFGPNSAGKIKPNVCATGEAIVAKAKGFAKKSGTSFSAPLVTGFAACAWQTHPQWRNMELFNAIEKSAHLYPYFDYAHGFGIPQADYFVNESETETEPTFDFVIINNEIKVILRERFSYPETETSLGYQARRNLYYKVEDSQGTMRRYRVLLAGSKEMLHFIAEEFAEGDVITVHFEGYTNSVEIASLPEN